MPWTSRPVPSSAFTVETVGGVTGYVPGALVQLRLQVTPFTPCYTRVWVHMATITLELAGVHRNSRPS